MSEFNLIGLTGPAGCGKDTIGSILRKKHGFDCYALAAPLRAGITAMLGIRESWMLDRDTKEVVMPMYGCSVRHMLQTLGTEWGRQMVHPNIWVYQAESFIEHAREDGKVPGVVVTDVRFDNESDYIRLLGGTVVHVERPDVEGVKPHSSENGVAWKKHDRVIRNTGGLVELEWEVGSLLRRIRGGKDGEDNA